MNNTNIPNNENLPSVGKLIKSTILAMVMAAVILITVVLPAEYGIDPTGMGKLMGLAKMGEIKMSLAEEAATEQLSEETAKNEIPAPVEANEIVVDDDNMAELNSVTKEFTLEPNQGKEIKLTMVKGHKINYVWFTDGDKANFDAHADSKTLGIKYHNYEKGKLERSEGVLEAAFNGNHGWFWRNRTDKIMTVSLEVSGQFSQIVEY